MKDKLKTDGWNPSEIIFGTDPKAVQYLKEVYDHIKDKHVNNTKLNFFESCILRTIEEDYGNILNREEKEVQTLLEEANRLLQDPSKWNENHKALYSAIENIVSLSSEFNIFNQFYEDIENVVAGVFNLDYSLKANTAHFPHHHKNIFNYSALVINLIIERVKENTVSNKAVNALLSLNTEEAFLFVTDKKGIIRFVNDYAEEELSIKSRMVIGNSLSEYIDDFDSILNQIEIDHSINAIEVVLSKFPTEKFILKIPLPLRQKSEIEELVFSIKRVPDKD